MTETKFCIDCRHYQATRGHHLCHAPPHVIRMVDGTRETEFADLRRKHGPCGPSARMFEPGLPRPAFIEQHIFPRPKPWWRFWK